MAVKVVLFSGGVDSLVHLAWAVREFGRANVQAVYFDVGQVYAPRESARAQELADMWDVPFAILRPMRLREDPATAQVEFRNAFLILWAATLVPDCDGVVFGMLQGEAPADKNPRFVRRMQTLVRDMRRDSIYADGQTFEIHVPFARASKAAMLRWYIVRYGRRTLQRSVGCFAADLPMCGKCWSCFNRWLAFTENSAMDGPYQQHPAEAMLQRLRGMWRNPTSRERRGWQVSRAWARRAWLWQCWRQLDRYARSTYGCSAVSMVLRDDPL